MPAKKKKQPLPEATNLSNFENLEVVASAIEIPGAAGGLRDAMAVEPQEFKHGERVMVVLECFVGKVRIEPILASDPHGKQRRVHIFNAETATIIDSAAVDTAIEAQKERIFKAREEAEGKSQFDFPPNPEEDAIAKNVRAWLGHTKREDLRKLCDEYEIPYSSRTTANHLVEALILHAPAIAAKLEAAGTPIAEAE